jgi:hypothetical protein
MNVKMSTRLPAARRLATAACGSLTKSYFSAFSLAVRMTRPLICRSVLDNFIGGSLFPMRGPGRRAARLFTR